MNYNEINLQGTEKRMVGAWNFLRPHAINVFGAVFNECHLFNKFICRRTYG